MGDSGNRKLEMSEWKRICEYWLVKMDGGENGRMEMIGNGNGWW